MPSLAGWSFDTEYGWHPKFDKMIAAILKLSANDSKGSITLANAVEEIWDSRPMTLVHSDLNAGNTVSRVDVCASTPEPQTHNNHHLSGCPSQTQTPYSWPIGKENSTPF